MCYKHLSLTSQSLNLVQNGREKVFKSCVAYGQMKQALTRQPITIVVGSVTVIEAFSNFSCQGIISVKIGIMLPSCLKFALAALIAVSLEQSFVESCLTGLGVGLGVGLGIGIPTSVPYYDANMYNNYASNSYDYRNSYAANAYSNQFNQGGFYGNQVPNYGQYAYPVGTMGQSSSFQQQASQASQFAQSSQFYSGNQYRQLREDGADATQRTV